MKDDPALPSPDLPSYHFEDLLRREFAQESDRACVILAVALLDMALETLLKARLAPVSQANDSLLEGAYAPLATFSARIDLCHRIGLISERFARDLHLIRKIRNDFAHNVSGCTFSDSAVRSRIVELARSHRVTQNHPAARASLPTGPRGDFQIAISWMQFHLRQSADRTESIDPRPPEWGYAFSPATNTPDATPSA